MEARKPSQTLPLLALFGGALGIAFAPIFAKVAMRDGGVGPATAAFWRVAVAAPVFWIWMALRRRSRPAAAGVPAPLAGAGTRWLLVPGVFFAADLGTWHWSFSYTTVANATLLANFATVIVSFIAYFWLKERFGPLFALGAVVAIGGVVLLLLSSRGARSETGTARIVGDALALGTACFYAGYLLSVKRLRDRHGVVPIMAWSTFACALCLLPVALLEEANPIPDRPAWPAIFGMAWISHCGGQGLIAFALARLRASFSSVGLLIQPVCAALWGWLLLGEALTACQMAAGGVVLAGIVLARLGSREERGAPTPAGIPSPPGAFPTGRPRT